MEKQNSKYRWVVFACVLFSYLLIATQRTTPGLITDQLMAEFNITAAAIGLLTSIQFLAYAGLQIPIGILSDRYGPNFFLIIGTILNGIGTLLYSFAANELVLLAARILVGMGDATIWVNMVLILGQWFKIREFVKLLGVAGMTGSLGFLMATVPFSAWISLTGWRPLFLTVGIVLCLLGIFLYFILVKKPRELFQTASAIHQTMQTHENILLLLKRIFSSKQAWATFFCHFGVVGTYIGFIGSWAVPFGMQLYGLNRSAASQLIMVGLFGSIIGAPLTTWVTTRIGSIKRPYVLVQMIVFLSWIGFFLFSGQPPYLLLFVLFFLIGYGNGASAITFAIVRKSFSIKDAGVVSGFANTGGFLSAVLLPGMFGKVLDHFQGAEISTGYHYGFIIPMLFSLCGLIGIMMVKENRQEEKQPNLA